MQTIWKGVLSFGLVNVPVRLVSTTRRSRTSFRSLHARDHGPIKEERRCSVCNEPVGRDDVVKGAEISEGVYVPVTREELDAVTPDSSSVLGIEAFVDASAVDPIFRERSYALAPAPGGERAYALLLDALGRRGELAVGRLTLRNRENLVAIRPGDRLLYVDVLHYADEVRDLAEIEAAVPREANVSGEEAALADLILERLHQEWDPAKYEDRFEQSIRDLIEAKAQGEVIRPGPAAPKPSTVDLLSALRETLARADASGTRSEETAA